MRIVRDTIRVKGGVPHVATLRYTRHGPVVYEDTLRHLAYAVRAAWLEPGGAPYLASLRMDQARTWEEFRQACSYSHIPGENMIWADVRGNIGWQAVGIAPIRRNWSGLVPVAGDGRYEWAGYLPILQKPHVFNPPSGFIATANNDLIPPSYPHRDAVGWVWADPYRAQRIAEVLSGGRGFTVESMSRLQTDYTSLPARALVPLLGTVRATDAATERARTMLLSWNRVLDRESAPAGIYEAWLRRLSANVGDAVAPTGARASLGSLSLSRLVEWLTTPGSNFGVAPRARRDSLLLASLEQAVRELTGRYGSNPDAWTWGRYHHVEIEHPMTAALNAEQRKRFNLGPWPRGGDATTPGATGQGENQTSGASFRLIVEAGDWDGALGTNAPGQSGDVRSPHYRDLFELWKNDRYFPVRYSRAAVERVTRARTVMTPSGGR
jgi:penicillin amidase